MVAWPVVMIVPMIMVVVMIVGMTVVAIPQALQRARGFRLAIQQSLQRRSHRLVTWR